jgi:basic membrane lipoprotein Med (substrate-binding protein (PBP1-ABC) superfamily)
MDRMKDYRQLIKELPSTTLVCAFGDFDPPTTAHELMVKTVNRLAEQKNTDHVIYASTKDSLIQEEKKEQYLKLMFPKTNFKSVNESKINNLLEELGKKYKKIVIVTGSEQVDKLKKLVKENTSIQIIPITEKNPDANFAKMKQLATKDCTKNLRRSYQATFVNLMVVV